MAADELRLGCRKLHADAGSSAPGHKRAPPQLPRARALAAASSSPRPRHGELGACPPTSSTPECTGGPQQAAPPCAGREARPRDPVHGSSLSIEKEERGCVDTTYPEAPDVRAQAFPNKFSVLKLSDYDPNQYTNSCIKIRIAITI
jgi:hypothetical protein